jgi:hypothetical protein
MAIAEIFLREFDGEMELSVYLPLNDVPLPPIYGPSADEAASF